MKSKGKLSLVGAGPGDPELITIKALKELEQTDVILYDALVNPKIFDLINTSADLIFVGKRMGQKSMNQEQINNLILEKLERGLKVTRLKGGDPLIFARGIEELELAREHGYDYQVIPGLTSGLAVPVSKAITLTRRGQSDSVTLVTGHEVTEEKLEHWARIIDTGATLIVYMGLSNVVEIMEGLKENLDPELPAIAIHNGTLEDEKMVSSNVGELAQKMLNNGIKAPAILIFGRFVDPGFKPEQAWQKLITAQ